MADNFNDAEQQIQAEARASKAVIEQLAKILNEKFNGDINKFEEYVDNLKEQKSEKSKAIQKEIDSLRNKRDSNKQRMDKIRDEIHTLDFSKDDERINDLNGEYESLKRENKSLSGKINRREVNIRDEAVMPEKEMMLESLDKQLEIKNNEINDIDKEINTIMSMPAEERDDFYLQQLADLKLQKSIINEDVSHINEERDLCFGKITDEDMERAVVENDKNIRNLIEHYRNSGETELANETEETLNRYTDKIQDLHESLNEDVKNLKDIDKTLEKAGVKIEKNPLNVGYKKIEAEMSLKDGAKLVGTGLSNIAKTALTPLINARNFLITSIQEKARQIQGMFDKLRYQDKQIGIIIRDNVYGLNNAIKNAGLTVGKGGILLANGVIKAEQTTEKFTGKTYYEKKMNHLNNKLEVKQRELEFYKNMPDFPNKDLAIAGKEAEIAKVNERIERNNIRIREFYSKDFNKKLDMLDKFEKQERLPFNVHDTNVALEKDLKERDKLEREIEENKIKTKNNPGIQKYENDLINNQKDLILCQARIDSHEFMIDTYALNTRRFDKRLAEHPDNIKTELSKIDDKEVKGLINIRGVNYEFEKLDDNTITLRTSLELNKITDLDKTLMQNKDIGKGLHLMGTYNVKENTFDIASMTTRRNDFDLRKVSGKEKVYEQSKDSKVKDDDLNLER